MKKNKTRQTPEEKFRQMTEEPVHKLILSLAAPSILSNLVTSIYNLTDTFFVSSLGTSASGAIGISFVAMTAIQAVGFYFGQGTGNAMSRYLGRQETDKACIMGTNGLAYTLLFGLAIAILGNVFIDPICRLAGSTETILPYARTFIGIICECGDFHFGPVKNDDGFPVVKDVSFEIHEGEIFAIAGVSGNGQTQIADAIAGLLPAAEGAIQICGRDISELDIRARAAAGISYIPEDRQMTGLILDFVLSDDLALRKYNKEPFEHKGVRDQKVTADFGDKLIGKYDIRSANGVKTLVRSMSGGNQQKAIVAREIEQNAKLTIFVQPTRGLDIGAIENIHRQILGERDKGKAVLLISLELDEIMQLADTIGVIFSGSIGKIAPAAEFTTAEVGEYMMGVKKE